MTQTQLALEPETDSACAKLARWFRDRPGLRVSAWDVMQASGHALAWRTRVSDLRKPPFRMDIQNEQEQHGRQKRSFYRYVGNL